MDAMSVAETESVHPFGDTSQVFLWRFQRSLDMGFGRRLADRIAANQIDLHELERLISSGCRLRTAYRILRP